MSTDPATRECIQMAAESVGSVWPLHSFVTANPLAGFEDQPFHDAIADAEQVLGGNGYPSTDVFRRALETGQIDRAVLQETLAEHGYDSDPETSLDAMAESVSGGSTDTDSAATDRVDAVLAKWLAAFLDQGQADWPMPNREDGFYGAFRTVVPHDSEIPDGDAVAPLPAEPLDAVRDHLEDHPVGEWQDIFEFQLSALPGWTGLLRQRIADETAWQSAYPVTLEGYLAARLALVDQFDAPLTPASEDQQADSDGERPLPAVWLRAWEATYRGELVGALTDASADLANETSDDRPDAQLVFCIDTRSEIIRRHIEDTGDYETHGYAGFFGVPMRYSGYDSDVTVDACPPIVDAAHRIDDEPADTPGDKRNEHDRWQATLAATREAIETLESNAATAFSYVESAGAGYGTALAARTLLPARLSDLLDRTDEQVPDDHEFCEPTVDHDPAASHDLPAGLTLDEKVEYAASAFELMGWEQFARVVVFAGHASQTANNPFDSSLDCGACAGNPGGPSARVLATLCNDDAVQSKLRERGIEIPDDTVFVAGEHNTTTDEVELFTGDVPESHEADIEQLRADLESARAGATAERAEDMGVDTDTGVRETKRRSVDWAETRPEWGLAGNAGFVVGPRGLTDGLDLDGRSFLHSYDWQTDPEGDALEAILAGPMVVTQWINTQYYFATVDNAVYGSGSKVTHNPVGNVGVYQGNGGDIMTGLPLQSLMSEADEPYHQPVRLSTVVHAPVERVGDILTDHEELAQLLDNDWLSLTVVDPEQDHRALHYAGEGEWTPVDEQSTTPPATNPSAAAD